MNGVETDKDVNPYTANECRELIGRWTTTDGMTRVLHTRHWELLEKQEFLTTEGAGEKRTWFLIARAPDVRQTEAGTEETEVFFGVSRTDNGDREADMFDTQKLHELYRKGQYHLRPLLESNPAALQTVLVKIAAERKRMQALTGINLQPVVDYTPADAPVILLDESPESTLARTNRIMEYALVAIVALFSAYAAYSTLWPDAPGARSKIEKKTDDRKERKQDKPQW